MLSPLVLVDRADKTSMPHLRPDMGGGLGVLSGAVLGRCMAKNCVRPISRRKSLHSIRGGVVGFVTASDVCGGRAEVTLYVLASGLSEAKW